MPPWLKIPAAWTILVWAGYKCNRPHPGLTIWGVFGRHSALWGALYKFPPAGVGIHACRGINFQRLVGGAL